MASTTFHPSLTPDLLADYYLSPEVRDSIVAQTNGRAVAFRMPTSGGGIAFKRNLTVQERQDVGKWRCAIPGGNHCFILDAPAINTATWGYWVAQGFLEIHVEVTDPTTSTHTDRVIVDLDPEGPVPPEQTVEVADRLQTLIDRSFPLKRMEVRYSGNRSLHVVGILPHPQPVVLVRERLATLCSNHLPPSLCRTKHDSNRWPYLYVDLGVMRAGATIRCLGSLHHKSGKACVRVSEPLFKEYVLAQIQNPEFGTRAWVAAHPESIVSEG